MRDKIAKKLRRLAEKMTVGQPPALYRRNNRGMGVLAEDCTRYEYKLLKIGYKARY